ncbi:hypothetical protein NEPAR04_2215 [Nematocida parisii]|nr:hypothetical protein NEPAR04_2215 [Nematocida parisii]KAI5193050.1 hypothetical protein NECID01_2166 [Nematocida sp. AWRm77]
MAKIVIVQNIFLLIWARAVLVCCAGSSHPDAERVYASMPNLAAVASYYLNSSLASAYGPRNNVYHDCEPLDLSCKTGARESSSCSSATIPTTSNTPTHACSSSAAKRIHEEAEKKNGEKKVSKKQKTNTNTTSTAAVANTALMDEKEACLMIEEFGRCFVEDTKISDYTLREMAGLANNLAQRGLASTHSGKIVELCTASEQWLGHDVFWRMLMFFVDRLSLEVADLNWLEDKKTVVLRDRIREKPLSGCSKDHICRTIAKVRGAERMEIQCSLSFLESRGTVDVQAVFKWLLHHVNIQCVGVSCDLTEAGMNSTVLGRHVEALTKEWRGSSVCTDSLALHFTLPQYKDAAVVVKECPWVTVLKMHFIDAGYYPVDTKNQALKALLLHCPVLEQLSVFGLHIRVEHIRTIAAMHPQLVLLEVELLCLDTLVLSQKKEDDAIPVFPALKTLKLQNIYNYSDAGIEKFVGLFPSLEDVQIPARSVATSLIDALSKLRLLRSLGTVNGSLEIETVEYLLERLPALECLSIGVKYLDNKLAHALSKYTEMHTLKLRGRYNPGFLGSLLQPSPLMNMLKTLCVCRNSGTSYRRGNFSTEDISSKGTAMKNFGCAVEIKH